MANGRDEKKYVGILNDQKGGMTDSGKIIRDAWVFGLIAETETCEGWVIQGIQALWEQTEAEWEKYGFLVNNLPPELRQRFDRIQGEAIIRAKQSGWDPERDLDSD